MAASQVETEFIHALHWGTRVWSLQELREVCKQQAYIDSGGAVVSTTELLLGSVLVLRPLLFVTAVSNPGAGPVSVEWLEFP